MDKHFNTLQENKGSQVAKSILRTKEITTVSGTVEGTAKQNSGKNTKKFKIYSCTNGNMIYEIMPPQTSEKTVDF